MVEVVIDRQSDENAVRGYAFYDWGKSAFETSVTTAILPFWFSLLFLEANGLTTTVLSRSMSSDAIWSFSVSGAALLVAVISPSLGVIADRRAIKMWWLRMLTYLGAGATFLTLCNPISVSRSTMGLAYGHVHFCQYRSKRSWSILQCLATSYGDRRRDG